MADAREGHETGGASEIADLILRLRRVGITDQRVVSAIESVPRELFVPPESQRRGLCRAGAADRLRPDHQRAGDRRHDDRGARPQATATGCSRSAPARGYQTAILAQLVPARLHDRPLPHAGRGGRVPLPDAAPHQHHDARRRRHAGLAGAGAVRPHHRHRRRRRLCRRR